VRVNSPGRAALLALCGYSLLSFLYFGLRLLVQPGSRYIGVYDDPQIPIWSFAWWPHAVAHGINPFVAHVIWAPHGVNLAWVNSLPPVALVLSPVTWAAGPVAAYNVAAVLLPALSAWTGYLLCRYLTGKLWPSLLGGYLFGFSSYMLGHLAGQPQLTAVFLLPLAALLVLRYLDGRIGRRRLAVSFGLLFGLQLYLALEVAFSLTIALVCALVLAYVFAPERRPRLRSALGPLAVAYGIGALFAAPQLYYALTDLRRRGFTPPNVYIADLLNFVLPTHVEWWGAGWAQHIAKDFAGNDTEQGVFLGALLIVIVLYAWQRWRTAAGRFLLACVLLAAYATLGPKLTVDGHGILPLPTVFGHDRIAGHSFPVFNNTLPVRFAVYTALATAVIAALWAASRPRDVSTWVLSGLAVLLLVPNPAHWTTRYSIPRFFTDARYRPCLGANAIVLPQPIDGGGQANLWQAVDHFRFRMAGGRLQTSAPSAFLHPRSIAQISVGYAPVADQAELLRAFIERYGVTDAIVDKRQAATWAPALDRIATGHDVGGVLLYPLSGPLPAACPAR
jgi:hypothetical protein